MYDCVDVDVHMRSLNVLCNFNAIIDLVDQQTTEITLSYCVCNAQVCGLVIPWNYPLMMLAWKMAACLAAGVCESAYVYVEV